MSSGTTIFGDKKFPLLKRASVWHDDQYRLKHLGLQMHPRAWVDREFFLRMRDIIEMDVWALNKRAYMQAANSRYWLVRKLGWFAWAGGMRPFSAVGGWLGLT